MDKNTLSIPVATSVALGAIIGAGIFVLSGTAIALAGAYALAAFLLVGVLAFIIAMELGELGSLFPNVKGAAYSYTYKALGSELGFITGILSYVSFATAIGAIALGFGSYLASFIGASAQTYAIPFAIALIFALSVVNLRGVKKAAQADLWLVAIKIGVLLAFVCFALYAALEIPGIGLSNLSFAQSGGTLGGIFAASVAVFFAYTGFQAISSITDRIRNGTRGYIKAILSAVGISIVLYVLVVVALLLLLPASAYKITADPLSYALLHVNAPVWLFTLVDIGALVATTSAALAMILTASRALYQMSEDRLLPGLLRKYNPRTDAAVNGVIISAVIAVLVLFAGNVYVIAAISNFGLMFAYVVVGFDVVHVRMRNMQAPFRTPLYPYLPLLSIALLFALFAGMPAEALMIGVVLIMALIGVYYALREIRKKKTIRIKLFD